MLFSTLPGRYKNKRGAPAYFWEGGTLNGQRCPVNFTLAFVCYRGVREKGLLLLDQAVAPTSSREKHIYIYNIYKVSSLWNGSPSSPPPTLTKKKRVRLCVLMVWPVVSVHQVIVFPPYTCFIQAAVPGRGKKKLMTPPSVLYSHQKRRICCTACSLSVSHPCLSLLRHILCSILYCSRAIFIYISVSPPRFPMSINSQAHQREAIVQIIYWSVVFSFHYM